MARGTSVSLGTVGAARMESRRIPSGDKYVGEWRNGLPNGQGNKYRAEKFLEPGGLMSYGTDRADLFRRAAIYVDKILKGRMPADLPVEQPKKFEFIINLKAAKQVGLTIPPNALARADKVIK